MAPHDRIFVRRTCLAMGPMAQSTNTMACGGARGRGETGSGGPAEAREKALKEAQAAQLKKEKEAEAEKWKKLEEKLASKGKGEAIGNVSRFRLITIN